MKIRFIFLAFSVFLMWGCSKETSTSSQTGSNQSVAAPNIATFPATLEGNLVIENANDWGYYGSLKVGGSEYFVAIPTEIYEGSNVPDTGGKVSITFESKQEVSTGIYHYLASSLKKL